MIPQPVRIALVDDHPALRAGTRELLEQREWIVVARVTEDVEEARAILRSGGSVDVVVLDLHLGTSSGLALLHETRAVEARPAIVVWTGYDLPTYRRFAKEAGAAAFVGKTAPLGDLVSAIRAAAAGEGQVDMPSTRAPTHISTQDRDTVKLVVAGLSNDEIAARLGIGSRTVELRLTRLYRRFSVRTRPELVVMLINEGWLDLPPDTSAD